MALLSWSIYDSLSKSFNFIMFIVEFTDGIKLGILINFIVFLFLVVNKTLQILLFGSLRMIEVEHLFEKLPIFAITLLLNLATGDNNIIMNVFLLGLAMSFKVFHIIIFDRLDYVNLIIVNRINTRDVYFMEVVKHFGTSINFWLNVLFTFIDFSLAKFLVYDVFRGINSVTCLLFGFQFAVQGVHSLTYFCKLLLGIYEIIFYRIRKNDVRRHEEEEQEETEETEVTDTFDADAVRSGNLGEADMEDEEEEDDDDLELVWENKPYYTKGVDIASEVLSAIAYLSFIYLLTIHSGLSLPLSMLQGAYSSLRNAWIQINQLRAFIESSKRLDTQLANADAEDLAQSDNLCIICREDMHSPEDYQRLFKKPQSSRRSPKKLKCGHILHLGCLKEWLERSDSCPLCRRKVFEPQPGNVPQQPPPQANINLNQGLREINEVLQANPPPQPQQRPQEPTPTPHVEEQVEGSSRDVALPSATTTTTNGLFQTISLPRNALLPPGWLLLPIEKTNEEGVDYKVKISNYHKADLKLQSKDSNTRNIKVYDVPKESPI
ncbi:HRD1 ERAD-associated E3 ubiquitin-protein ligase HRD1 [Candida maltosa Xu316]